MGEWPNQKRGENYRKPEREWENLFERSELFSH